MRTGRRATLAWPAFSRPENPAVKGSDALAPSGVHAQDHRTCSEDISPCGDPEVLSFARSTLLGRRPMPLAGGCAERAC